MPEKVPTGIMSPEAERYFGVILEQIDGKFQTLLEGQFSLAESMDRLEVRMDRLEARIDRLELEVIAIKQEIGEIRAELKLCIHRDDLIQLEGRVSKIEKKLGIS